MLESVGVVILAAGKSTRFKSDTSKLLHELCGKPMLEWVLDAVLPLKPKQIVVVYGKHSEVLVERYREGYLEHELSFVLQDPPLGTGHALAQVQDALKLNVSHLLVLPGDAPLVRDVELKMLADALKRNGAEHAVLTATVDPPGDLGRVLRRGEMVECIVEAHEAKDAVQTVTEVNTGVYLFSRRVFDHLASATRQVGPSKTKGEYYLPDVVLMAPTLAVHAPDFVCPIGVNDRHHFALAEEVLLDRLRRYWMEQGVTFRLPETSYLHHNVVLAPDVEIGPHCVLTEGTRVGRGTRLVQGCLLETCVIGEYCELRHVRGLFAVLEDNVAAGPYVNMRPGTVLREGVKVGNFVETKNADVGPGSKLPHLQYVGDATLGRDVNIGAGTIFCNYDGFMKHHTILGDEVFIGSNASLQGGITIGPGAYVAMGSSITKDVPADDLAIGRARQENKKGYAKRLKEQLRRRKEEAERNNNKNKRNKSNAGGAM